jgi:DNA polymerase-3 subunit delta'
MIRGEHPSPAPADGALWPRAGRARLIEAWSAGRLHHAFLIAGPQGIGKATFAYRVASSCSAIPIPPA